MGKLTADEMATVARLMAKYLASEIIDSMADYAADNDGWEFLESRLREAALVAALPVPAPKEQPRGHGDGKEIRRQRPSCGLDGELR